MLSVTCQHAIRAVVAIAESGDDGPVLARSIAEATEIPRGYLQKVLRDLVRAGILISVRGQGGGFRLKRPPDQITLAEVLDPFDGTFRGPGCPFARRECDANNPCPAHDAWHFVVDAYRTFTESNTVRDMMNRGASVRPRIVAK